MIQEPESRDPMLLELPVDDDGARHFANWLFPIYTLLLVAGFLALQMKGVMHEDREMNIPQAVMTAVDSGTLTGMHINGSIVPDPNTLLRPGKIIVVALNLVGSLFSLIVGGIAVSRILRLPFRAWMIVFGSLLFETGAAAVGYFLLRDRSGDGWDQLLTGLSRGIGAFGNHGILLGTSPFGLYDWQTYALLLPLAVLGGLGITVLLELLVLVFRRRLSQHARTVLLWTFGLYAVATLLFTLIQWQGAHFTRDPDRMREIWATSSVMAIVSRTAGFSGKYGAMFPRAMEWLIMLLMVIGANPGGTGGGLKTTTLSALGSGTRRLLRGENPGRPLGIAISWLGLYLGMLFFGIIALLYTEPQSGAERVMMMAISALGNVGLSHDLVSTTIPGMFILSALMLAGRMVPLLILWWMADTTSDADLAVG